MFMNERDVKIGTIVQFLKNEKDREIIEMIELMNIPSIKRSSWLKPIS